MNLILDNYSRTSTLWTVAMAFGGIYKRSYRYCCNAKKLCMITLEDQIFLGLERDQRGPLLDHDPRPCKKKGEGDFVISSEDPARDMSSVY